MTLKHKPVSAGGELSPAEKRSCVRFALSEMTDEQWRLMRESVDSAFTHPRKDDELWCLERVFREGKQESRLDVDEPARTHGNSKGLIHTLISRIVSHPGLMGEFRGVYNQLRAIPVVTREELHHALPRMPKLNRDYVLSRIPDNPQLADTRRDREIVRRHVETDVSDEALAGEWHIETTRCKAIVGFALMDLVEKPLVCREVVDYMKSVEDVLPMSPQDVEERLRKLDKSQVAEVINAIPADNWKRRSVIGKHKEAGIEYFSGDWAGYSGFARAKGMREQSTRGLVLGILDKIASEPELCDRLRLLSGEVNESEVKPMPQPASQLPLVEGAAKQAPPEVVGAPSGPQLLPEPLYVEEAPERDVVSPPSVEAPEPVPEFEAAPLEDHPWLARERQYSARRIYEGVEKAKAKEIARRVIKLKTPAEIRELSEQACRRLMQVTAGLMEEPEYAPACGDYVTKKLAERRRHAKETVKHPMAAADVPELAYETALAHTLVDIFEQDVVETALGYGELADELFNRPKNKHLKQVYDDLTREYAEILKMI